MDSLVARLLHFADTQPGALAIIDRGQGVTYGALGQDVKAAAAWLHQSGVRAGDTVALSLDTSPESSLPSLQFFYGLAYLGAVVLPVYPDTPSAALSGLVQHFGARHWIHGRGQRPTANISLLDPLGFHPAQYARLSAMPPRGDEPERPFLYLFTSGTTGAFKVVLFSVAQIAGWAFSLFSPFESTAGDRHVAAQPWPMKVGIRDLCGTHAVGATFINTAVPQTRQELAALITLYGVSQLSTSPLQLRTLLNSETPPDLRLQPLRVLSVGGAPIFPQEILAARQTITPNVYITYGANEMMRITCLRPLEPADPVGKVGKPIAHVEAHAVDEEDKPLPAGTVGKLRFRSPSMAQGYVGNEEATARNFRHGWFYPGDVGLIDAEGNVVLRGRTDDMINCGGAKIVPNDIEPTLRQHPAIADVAVAGVPHALAGQVPIAFVVLRQSVDLADLHQFCAQRIDAKQLPAHFVAVQEIPRNPEGKVLRDRLCQAYLKENVRT